MAGGEHQQMLDGTDRRDQRSARCSHGIVEQRGDIHRAICKRFTRFIVVLDIIKM